MSVERSPSKPAADPHLPALLRVINLNQQDVARRAGVPPETFSRALHGRRRLSADTLARLELAILREIAEHGVDP